MVGVSEWTFTPLLRDRRVGSRPEDDRKRRVVLWFRPTLQTSGIPIFMVRGHVSPLPQWGRPGGRSPRAVPPTDGLGTVTNTGQGEHLDTGRSP